MARDERSLARVPFGISMLLVLAVALQVSLGAAVVLSGKQPLINTIHVAVGATVLVTALVITLRAYRVRLGS